MHISTLRRLYCTTNSIGIERNREKENTLRHIILQKGLQICIHPTAQNTNTPPHTIYNTEVSSYKMCSGSNKNASRNASQAKTKAYPKQARSRTKICRPSQKSW
jgi:hypothetical protein